jgi:Uma2 family endonuclease
MGGGDAMEANRSRHRWTYEEYARLPTPGEAGGTRFEVIDGELYVTPSPGMNHQRIVTDLVTLLNVFVQSHALGRVFVSPLDVLFGEGDYVEPDILFVRTGRARIITERGVEGAPDLVVEVLSPSTRGRDRSIKLERYRHFGVGEYWIVDPEQSTVEVWKLAAPAALPVTLTTLDTLRWSPSGGEPTLEISLTELFLAA